MQVHEQSFLYSLDVGVSVYKAVSSSLLPHSGNIKGTPQIALLQRIVPFFLKCLPALLQRRHFKQMTLQGASQAILSPNKEHFCRPRFIYDTTF